VCLSASIYPELYARDLCLLPMAVAALRYAVYFRFYR